MKSREQRLEEYLTKYPDASSSDFDWTEGRVAGFIADTERVLENLLHKSAKPFADQELLTIIVKFHQISAILDAEAIDRGF